MNVLLNEFVIKIIDLRFDFALIYFLVNILSPFLPLLRSLLLLLLLRISPTTINSGAIK